MTGTQPFSLEAESLTKVFLLGLGLSKAPGQNPSPKPISIFHTVFPCANVSHMILDAMTSWLFWKFLHVPTGLPKGSGALRFLSSRAWLPGGLGWRTALGTILGSPQMSPSCEQGLFSRHGWMMSSQITRALLGVVRGMASVSAGSWYGHLGAPRLVTFCWALGTKFA